MIFSRFAQEVKGQHWLTFFIDFVIVVVGVFIGLQANNWNAARADRGIVARHLTEIAEDLQSRHALEDELYGSALGQIAAVDYIYAEAFDKKLPAVIRIGSKNFIVPKTPQLSANDLDHLMGMIDVERMTVGQENGYRSLLSSGDLELVQNQNRSLARAIQIYYDHFDDLLEADGVFRSFRNNGAAVLYKYGVSIFDARPPGEIVGIARTHPDFAAYLRSQREWAVLHADLLKQQDAETVELLAKIEKELRYLK